MTAIEDPVALIAWAFAAPAGLTLHYTVYCSRRGPQSQAMLLVHSLFTGHKS